mgnify:CR=1 FL=1
MATDYKIMVQNVTKEYDLFKTQSEKLRAFFALNRKPVPHFWSLMGISLKVMPGETLGLIGVNGSGKSTLSNIISGIIPQTSGVVDVRGDTSIIAIGAGLRGNLTGVENIRLKALMQGLTNEEIDALMEDIVSFADIGDFLYQPVKSYSSGMKSRLGFAISVNVNPDILIVDEVLSVGDDVFKLKCIDKREEFKRKGKTIFFVSHSLFTVKSFCNKCMWIKDGELMCYGETGEIMVQYENFLKEEKAKDREKKKQEALESNKTAQIMSKADLLQFSNFTFVNSQGEKTSKFQFGEEITFQVNYEIKKTMEDLVWCFTIRDAETNEIFGSDKKSHQNALINTIGTHTLKVTLKQIKQFKMNC